VARRGFRTASFVRWLSLLLVASLSGCRQPYYQVALPNGGYAWAVECETKARCFETIGYICDNGYRVIDHESSQEARSGFVATKDFAVANSRSGEVTTMMFVCK